MKESYVRLRERATELNATLPPNKPIQVDGPLCGPPLIGKALDDD